MNAVYNAAGGRELRLDSLALGEVQPWSIIDRGLEYPGEVIVAETVNPEWGQPLEGDACFRIIFYTVPRRIPAGQIRDPRIAMAVAMGDQWTNMIQPLFAIPLLAIAGLHLRDIMGYCVITLLYTGMIFLAALTFF